MSEPKMTEAQAADLAEWYYDEPDPDGRYAGIDGLRGRQPVPEHAMTDEPATTPAADRPDQGDVEAARLLVELAREASQCVDPAVVAIANQTPSADRVTALTLRCGQLREQRDEARAQLDEAYKAFGRLRSDRDAMRRERDAARAQAVAATTDADDLRARVGAVVAPWPPGIRKGDILRAIGEGE